jgi:hypothetical protein
MEHEWDFPPPRRRRSYRTIDYHQPSGWSSPIARKIVRVYLRVMVTAIKMLLAIPLSLLAVGSIWFLWIIITLLRK